MCNLSFKENLPTASFHHIITKRKELALYSGSFLLKVLLVLGGF